MRYLHKYIQKDLQKKMVFIGGPRQCGKTTLAKRILKQATSVDEYNYFNWDDDQDRQNILKRKFHPDSRLIVLDEIHKYSRWKNWLKGLYDTQKNSHNFLVTGSARLDVYRRGGDSMMGRYHYWRLHPFTLSEIPKGIGKKETYKRLLSVGGFPEPFLDNNEREARRWRRERQDKILKDDVRDLEAVTQITTMGLLLDKLKTRVGGMVVFSNLAEELFVSPKTIRHWIEILEKMYVLFCVWPYSKNMARAIRKPPKIYFYDNADVEGDEGVRFENLVANHLLKKNQFMEDYEGYRYELRYVRDKEGHEVDFVILKDGKVDELIEAKLSDGVVSPSLAYFANRLKPTKAYQLVGEASKLGFEGNLRSLDAVEELSRPFY